MTSSTHDLVPRTHTTSGISPAPYREGISLYPAPGEFVEHVLVQSLTLVAGPHRQEDVSPDELMYNLAVCGETMKRDLLVEADLDLLNLPVDVPRLHVLEAPSLGRVARVHVHQRHAVRPDTQQLLRRENTCYNQCETLWREIPKFPRLVSLEMAAILDVMALTKVQQLLRRETGRG